MKIDFNPIVLFHLLAVIQGVTTSVLLLTSQRKQRQNLWLGLLMIAMTLQVMNSFFISSGIYQDFKILYFFPLFYSWGYGTLFYFYLQSSVNQSFTFQKRHWFHFIPLSIQALFYVFICLQNLDFKAWFWLNVHKPYTRFADAYVGIALVFAYLYVSYESLKKVDKRLQQFIKALSVFYIIAAVDPLFNHLYLPPRSPKFYIIEYILPIFAYWLGLIAYLRERHQQKEIEKNKQTRGEVSDNNIQKIIQIMQEKRLYLNPELSLSDLSEAVGLNTGIVSHTLNIGLGQSFNDFVNQYRVEAVKTKFTEGVHVQETLLAIAFDCGFNSKNTFNRAFKKNTGLSPKEYLEKFET